MVAPLSPGSRVVDPDEGSGGVSCSPGSHCSLQPSLDTLFIGWPIDYLLLRNIQRNLQQQSKNKTHLALYTEMIMIFSKDSEVGGVTSC